MCEFLHLVGKEFRSALTFRQISTKQNFAIVGLGTVSVRGVYQGLLNFSELPPSFHPVVVSAYIYSTCCYANAATRSGALNLMDMGVSGYTERSLKFPDRHSIKIRGNVECSLNGFGFNGEMHGSVPVPDDIIGHSFYTTFLQPEGAGRIVGKGESSCFCDSGKDFPVQIETIHAFDRGKSLPKPQFRIVTDYGALDGLSYNFTLHSVLDRANTMLKVSS